jgi:hypothetical protein
MTAHFVPPGRRTDPTISVTKLGLAKAYALSRACNPRNVEYYSYALWCQYWMELTNDSKNLVVNPQYLLYYIPDEIGDEVEEGEEDMEVHKDGIDDADEEKQDNYDGEEGNFNDILGNTTIDTIESGASTKPERSAEEIVPDFAIIRIKYRFRHMEQRKTWENTKIRHAGVPLLAENKRAGKRSLTNVPFLKSTNTFIHRAQDDLFRQAAYLFTMHPRQQSVILVACSGIYWSCMIADRQYVLAQIVPAPSDDFIEVDDEEDSDEEMLDEDAGEEDEDTWAEAMEEDFDELDLISEPGYLWGQNSSSLSEGDEETEEMYLEPIVAEDHLMIPENTWTQLLCLDSKASNQKMFLIHSRLRAVARDATGANG